MHRLRYMHKHRRRRRTSDGRMSSRLHVQVKALLERELMIHSLVGDEPIEVFVDAFKVAIAGVIIQNGKLISSVSRTLTKAERKHHIIELEALAIRYSLQKMKHFLHGREFTVFTDHKPLLGIWKKAALIENIRLLSSVLAVTEYQFEMKHIEGEKNVLADYGSRQIDSSQYPTAEELSGMDDFLDTIFASLVDDNMQLPNIDMEDYTSGDYDELQKFSISEMQQDGVLYVTHRGERLIYVPSKLRQAFFHCIHTTKHMGVTEMCATTKQLGYYFPLMQDKYLEFLSSCPCAGAKNYRTGLQKYKGKGITATRPMDLVALDLYMYDSINYLVMVDVYSRLLDSDD
uniref:Reverse transcriptase RNase H-like domain-containing protein n=1 Tax=Heterosigma akashiwo TaxID=2829 RepID=A0A7S3XZG2_HETAK